MQPKIDNANMKPFVFVLMPFDPASDKIYEAIEDACSSVGAGCDRVDKQIFAESILKRIYDQIAKADIVVSEMTGRNPNVFYETGYAHALKKRVIPLTQNANDIPFDLKDYYHIIYDPANIDYLKTELAKRIRWFIDNPIQEVIDVLRRLTDCKELHNKINNILVSFDQFKRTVDCLEPAQIVQNQNPGLLQTVWRPVQKDVDELLGWSKDTEYFVDFQDLGPEGRKGEEWAVKFFDSCNKINQYVSKEGYTNRKQNPSFQSAVELQEYIAIFNEVTIEQMTKADKKLQETAKELLNISNKDSSKQ
jgi:hypothetical protein